MRCSSFDDSGGGELTSLGLVEISKIFTAQDDLFLGAAPFGKVLISS